MKNKLTIFGKEIIDDKTIEQLKNCLLGDSIGAITADGHYGYNHPIGGAVAYKNHISVSGVGFDIACGNKAVKTSVKWEDIQKDISSIMDKVVSKISFGVGRPNKKRVEHAVLDRIKNANFEPQRKLYDLAYEQIGTVGSGNHFVDLFIDQEGFMWIGVHFGSRGFGHKTATGFMSIAQGMQFGDKAKQGSMDDKPILLDINTYEGQAYIEAMTLAGDYAYAGRDLVVENVLSILGNPEVLFSVHNHHNFAWKETHFGEEYWVVRKGCTPAFPDQYGFIGANMRDQSVIIKGVDSELSKDGLYSTVHGAGRIMSRTQAAGKRKWVKGKPVRVAKGEVDFDQVKEELRGKVELRGAGADEAPQCYKSLKEVLEYQGDTIEVINYLTPVGVAMAGSDEYDPYKD